MYASGDGTEVVRQCVTWEEARMLAIEIEEDNAATRAITNPNFYNAPYSHEVSYGESKGKRPKGEGKAVGKGERAKGGGVCFDMLQHGKCDRENCRYSHEKKAIAAAKEEKGRKGAAVAAVDAEDPNWTAKAYQKGKNGKSKGKGKEGKEKWPGNGKRSDPESKKHILCKFIKKGEECPVGGKTCPYSHNKKRFEESYPTANAESASGAFGAPPPGLRMVNVTQESMPNPFQKWIVADGGGSLGDCVASVTPQDLGGSEKFFSRMWAQVVAAQEWTSVVWRFVVARVQKIFDTWEITGQRLAHKS